MLTPITAFEHQPVPVAQQGDHASLSETEAEHLLLIAESLRGFCTRGYRSIELSEHCGLVNLGSRVLEVLPKVGEATDAQAGRGVLLRLLRYASDLPVHRHADAGQSSRPAPLLDVFISAFFDEVFALVKGGLLRRYVEHEDDLLAVRGGIRLQRQFSTLANRTDLVACRFDELTPDNRWNQLLKAGLKVVRPWMRSLDLHRRWVELSAVFEDVSDVAHPRVLLADLRYDRQATRYRPAIHWVERILNLLSPDFRAGDRAAPSLLFDMNLLFERTVERKMEEWAWTRGWTLETQDDSRFLARIEGPPARPAYRIRPDLVFRYRGRIVAIADAKWKHPDVSGSGFALPAQADLYQLHAYASIFGCDQLALIYPWSEYLADTHPTVLSFDSAWGKCPQLTVMALDIGDETLPIRFIPNVGAWPST
jgi:5-methylcytosine-specific restriction enzyme subunit McrC